MIADLLLIALIVGGLMLAGLALYLPIAVARIEKHQADQVALLTEILHEIRAQKAPRDDDGEILHLTQDA